MQLPESARKFTAFWNLTILQVEKIPWATKIIQVKVVNVALIPWKLHRIQIQVKRREVSYDHF